MSKRLVFVLVLMALALFGLSGCTPCDMVSPDLVSPDWREVLDPSAAVLDWNYVDSCTPDNFEIILSKDSSFSVIEHTGTVASSTTIWNAPALDIAEEYFWRVRAEDKGVYGPYSLELRSFFTGPTCSAGDLVAPTLVYPAYGGIYDNDYESLEWAWPLSTCIPESYRVEVSMASCFVDDTFNGGTGTPGTRWGFGSTHPAGTQFWWRISAFADGAWGPSSFVSSFFTGPVCPAADLVAPELISPNSSGPSPVDPEFLWSYPDSSCIPEGFHLELYEDWEMTAPIFGVYEPHMLQFTYRDPSPFPDCQQFFWRVAMVTDDGSEEQFSDLTRFVVDTGSCDCAPGDAPIPPPPPPNPSDLPPQPPPPPSWRHPGDCIPDGELVKLSPDYDFDDSTHDSSSTGVFYVGYDPPGLDPATQYYWKVAYYVDDGGTEIFGDFSPMRSFFTGPECTSLAEVVAPVQLYPADGAVVNTLTPALHYTPGTPGCIPDGYLLHLHTLEDLSDPNLLGEFSLPGTTVLPEPPLLDCHF